MSPSVASLPLAGIRIADLSRLIPGGFCSAMLADLGAEVIKVEEPATGDYDREIPPFIGKMASRFLILNRNKKSLALNLKEPEGREIFLRLIAKSDVLLESFRPGALAKLGLDYDSLKAVNPGLIYCSISSFGQNGPFREVVAHDLNILGLSGILDLTGDRESGPMLSGIQIADSAAAMTAALAILAALLKRASSGAGEYLDVSMFDSALAWTFDAARYVFAGAKVPKRGESRLGGGLPNYRIYRTKDDRYLAVGSLEAKFKKQLLKDLGRSEMDHPDQGTTTKKVDEKARKESQDWEALFATKTQKEWLDRLGPLNICVSPVLDMATALQHPQARHRKMVVDIKHPLAGSTCQMGSAFKFSGAEVDLERLPAPQLGQQTKEILSSLGYSREERKRLEEGKVVGTASGR